MSQKIFGRKISPKNTAYSFPRYPGDPGKIQFAVSGCSKSGICTGSFSKVDHFFRVPRAIHVEISSSKSVDNFYVIIPLTRACRNKRMNKRDSIAQPRGGGHTRERSTALRMTELTMTDQMRWPDIAGPDRDGSSLFRVHTYVIVTNTLCQTVNVANNPTFSALCLQSTWKSHLRNPSYSTERHCEMSRNFNLVGYGTSDVRCA